MVTTSGDFVMVVAVTPDMCWVGGRVVSTRNVATTA